MTDSRQQNLAASNRVTLIGAALDLVLGILKIFVGITANSIALISDGVHSLSDLVTDGFVLIVSRFSHAGPDRDHPYGHRRFETLGTIILGVVLFAVAGIICFDSIRRIALQDPLPVPGWPGLVVAALSIASKEWIFRYTRQVSEKINSSLLLANAWHSRTDAMSSVAVLIGISGAMAGFPVMDQLAAVIVALMIGWIAWKLVFSSLSELVDTALPKDKVKAIREHALTMEGVLGTHAIRTRLHGGRSFVDLHIQVDERISVSEGHFLADRLTLSLKQAMPGITDVVVHVDPEPDNEPETALESLPLRSEVQALLDQRWHDVLGNNGLKRLELHYLGGQIDAEVYLDISILNSELEDNLNKLVKDFSWLGRVSFFGMP